MAAAGGTAGPAEDGPGAVAWGDLLARAEAAARHAYAPYSRFRVGAALLTPEGRVFTGCNVENASYGLSMCAERVALFKAVSEGARRFRAIAVAGPGPCPPCGACRQALAEFDPALPVVLAGADGEPAVHTLNQLLAMPFLPAHLGEPEDERR